MPADWERRFRQWPARFQQICNERGWQTQGEAARALGVSQGSISGWTKPYAAVTYGTRYETDAKKTPRILDLVTLADKLKISAPWLIFGLGVPTDYVTQSGLDSHGLLRVAIMGRVDHEKVQPQLENHGVETVELPFPIPESVIGFRVTGMMMYPCYRPGDILLVRKDQRFPTGTYIGDEVVVEVADGTRYIKELHPGRRKNLYTLASRIGYTIHDARVSWVGEIFCVWKSARKVDGSRETELSEPPPQLQSLMPRSQKQLAVSFIR